jgi:outer membrane lipoprotein-sorting protein
MKSADKIKRLFKNAAVRTRSAPDEAVFENIRAAYKRSIEDRSAQPKPIFGRFIMRSPKTKPAIAAIVVVLVGAVMLSLWQYVGSGIALADVLTKIEQITAYTYEINITTTRLPQSSTTTNAMGTESVSLGTVLISNDHGMRMTIETIDPNNENARQEMYVLLQKKTMVMVEPQKKSYRRYKLDDTMIERFKEQFNDPRSMIKRMLSCEYTSLGQAVIGGIDAEGFQTTDPAYSADGAFGQADVKVWVDAKTWLPVRSEVLVVEEIDGEVRTHRFLDNFQWNVPADAAEFEPNIPDDYTTRSGDITVPAFNEETAIKGFTVLADLAGEYPDALGGKTFFKELEALFAPMRDRKRSEKYTKLADITMPIGGLLSFYQTLVQGKKDPAYYGEFVTPKDADLVLMRWKTSDNEYRVIFGDLRAETVTLDTLMKLEKNLPK